MAQQNQENTSSSSGASFVKGMLKDLNESSIPEGAWSHAINATPVSSSGDLTTLGTEPSNLLCANSVVPYTIIGTIHQLADLWYIFSTDSHGKNEIGLFDDSNCTYTPLVSPQNPSLTNQMCIDTSCLNWKKENLITGAAKYNFDCSWSVYFADGNNPDRFINFNNIPLICQNTGFPNSSNLNLNDPSCYACIPISKSGSVTSGGTLADPYQLDCDKMRLASLMQLPCINLSLGHSGGNLLNGTYFVTGAYTVNGQVMSDYFPPVSIQPIFNHNNSSGSLHINFSNLDTTYFSEFQLVIVSNINLQTTAKIIGLYDTITNTISIDNIDPTLPDLPIELIPIITPEYEKSDAIFPISDYLARVGPTSNLDFNYQPLANNIAINWISTEYLNNYYKSGGNNASYLRDEVYCFFIRWVYNTGAKSSSYHIPGRASQPSDLSTNFNASEKLFGETALWQVSNTANIDTNYINYATVKEVTDDGGTVIAKGQMGYWESTENYPDNMPDVWGTLCGTPVRHHKMPGNFIYDSVGNPLNFNQTNHFFTDSNGITTIRLLGIEVTNVAFPLDNSGNLITNIVGYEILRGSREGNKSIIAKGMINNTREYTLTQGSTSTRQGIYPNYPYNPLGADPTISTTDTNPGSITGKPRTATPTTAVSPSVYTFHSPDTQFRHPFLSAKELKLDGEINGTVLGSFSEVPNHPKQKLITDFSFFIAAMIGMGAAIEAVKGTRTDKHIAPKLAVTGFSFAGPAGIGTDTTLLTGPTGIGVYQGTADGANLLTTSLFTTIIPAIYGIDSTDGSILTAAQIASIIPGISGGGVEYNKQWGKMDYQDPIIRAVTGVMMFGNYWTLGTNDTLDLIEALVPYKQYAYRYLSHGFYSNFTPGNATALNNNIRKSIWNANYLENQLQDFGSAYRINNLYRNRSVVLDLGNKGLTNPAGTDNTVQNIGNYGPNNPFNTSTTSYYGALKVELDGQYGQIGSVREVPISCITSYNYLQSNRFSSTGPIFGGDTYVCRYTEKNTFFYFYDWLFQQPDGYQFDYTKYYMVNYPRYWANFNKFEANEFLSGILQWFLSLGTSPLNNGLPSGRHNLDNLQANANGSNIFSAQSLSNAIFGLFAIYDAYFYLFQSGVRDFYVESEVNTEFRDWNDTDADRFYDPTSYTDLPGLFNPQIIKAGELFKYDYSLSISKLYSNLISWGNTQLRNYNPLVAAECYAYYPYKLIYSLPQKEEQKKDYWRVFLPNNYETFASQITTIKSINKSGVIILFESASPLMYQGVDQLQTGLGTKLTIGDGGLFSQPGQNIVNVEDSMEYGSCQNRLSCINTPLGTFWMCENQGKLFSYAGGIVDIGIQSNMKFWLKKFLPYTLTNDFPNYPLTDNPVAGIGCQIVYDNQIEILYFCKKDYSLLPAYAGRVVYNADSDSFLVDGQTPYQLGDPAIFQNASWTLSYDPKEKVFLSFHDWHPDLLISSKNTFVSIKDNQFYQHNLRVDSFANFYGIDYPFEVEYVAATGVTVNSLRSIEYYMEAYKYGTNGYDKFHQLDYGFDQAIIHNTEQVSGVLALVDTPKNDPFAALKYPIIGNSQISILYTKKEQKYRFNQFWDITDDRGEFMNSSNAMAQRFIWLWETNGYKRSLNSVNLNYNKPPLQRKKFRHYLTHVILRKLVSGPTKMLVKAIVDKNLTSKR